MRRFCNARLAHETDAKLEDASHATAIMKGDPPALPRSTLSADLPSVQRVEAAARTPFGRALAPLRVSRFRACWRNGVSAETLKLRSAPSTVLCRPFACL